MYLRRINAVAGVKKEDGTKEDANFKNINPLSNMQEIASAVNLENLLYGKFESAQRFEILSLSYVSIRLKAVLCMTFCVLHQLSYLSLCQVNT